MAAITLSVISFALSLSLLIPSLGRMRDRLIARILPDNILIPLTLWDECDGEPMNVFAEELQRRDEVAWKRRSLQQQGGEKV
jgi:hypothetical protein